MQVIMQTYSISLPRVSFYLKQLFGPKDMSPKIHSQQRTLYPDTYEIEWERELGKL